VRNQIKLAVQLTHGDWLGIDSSINNFLVLSMSIDIELRHGLSHRVYYSRLTTEWLANQHKPVKVGNNFGKLSRLILLLLLLLLIFQNVYIFTDFPTWHVTSKVADNKAF